MLAGAVLLTAKILGVKLTTVDSLCLAMTLVGEAAGVVEHDYIVNGIKGIANIVRKVFHIKEA